MIFNIGHSKAPVDQQADNSLLGDYSEQDLQKMREIHDKHFYKRAA